MLPLSKPPDVDRVALVEMADIFAGAMFWPVERADEVLQVWRTWLDEIPERVTSAARVMHFPPMPELPEPLRGKSYVVVEAAMLLEDHVATDLLAGGIVDRPGILASGKSSFSVVSPVAGSSVIALPSTCPRPENSAGGS